MAGDDGRLETGVDDVIPALMAGLIATAIDSILGADVEFRSGRASAELEGELVEVEVVTEAGAWLCEVILDIPSPDLASRLILHVPGVAPAAWQPVPRVAGVRVHAKAEFESLRGKSGYDPESGPAHIVRSGELVASLVDGTAVRSVCGVVFAPTRTGAQLDNRDICSRCLLILRLANGVLATLRESAP